MVNETVCKEYQEYLDFCIYWSANANVQGGYSDVYVKMYLHNWGIYSGSIPGYITVDGNREDFWASFNAPSYVNDVTIKERWLTVNHNSDGCKSCRIECNYDWKGNYGQDQVYINSFYNAIDVSFDCIDRSPPTVQLIVSNIQQTSFTIEGKSLYDNCFDWQYSINGGTSWEQFPNSNGNSTSADITGLTENTEYQVQVKAIKIYNQITGYSKSQTIKTLLNPTKQLEMKIRLNNLIF